MLALDLLRAELRVCEIQKVRQYLHRGNFRLDLLRCLRWFSEQLVYACILSQPGKQSACLYENGVKHEQSFKRTAQGFSHLISHLKDKDFYTCFFKQLFKIGSLKTVSTFLETLFLKLLIQFQKDELAVMNISLLSLFTEFLKGLHMFNPNLKLSLTTDNYCFHFFL